jgi:hypothetical protein
MERLQRVVPGRWQLLTSTFIFSFLLLLAAGPVLAADITGTPGSPGATTTIDGRYLPNPPKPFRGQISPNAVDSKPYWPELVVPPKGAPNVLLIMIDDEGFGAPSTFGGVIPTPAMDRRHGPRFSPAATTTRWPPASSSTRRPAIPATTASSRATPWPSARSFG